MLLKIKKNFEFTCRIFNCVIMWLKRIYRKKELLNNSYQTGAKIRNWTAQISKKVGNQCPDPID